MSRLSDEQLIKRTIILSTLLSKMDDSVCAKLFREGGSLPPSALLALGGSSLQPWLDLAYAAAVAEMENHPQPDPGPSDDEIGEAIVRVIEELPSSEADRFQAVMLRGAASEFREVSDADTCWYARTLFGNISELEQVHQQRIARMSVQIE